MSVKEVTRLCVGSVELNLGLLECPMRTEQLEVECLKVLKNFDDSDIDRGWVSSSVSMVSFTSTVNCKKSIIMIFKVS